MSVGAARAAAAEWVEEHAVRLEGFRGAYFSGSTVGLAAEAAMPAGSDVDIVVVTVHAEQAAKLGKFRYGGVLLEVTILPWREIASVEHVLASYHLAGSFRVDTIIADPGGELRRLQGEIARRFAERVWVQRRCEDARGRIERFLGSIDPSAPWHEQVMAWLFGTGVTTHVLLVAALRNPTVRRRYLACREVLIEYGYTDRYEDLLRLLGCAEMTPARVEHHLGALERTFDTAAGVARTPLVFSSDITAEARPVAIDGSRDLISAGFHREAVFWMVATFARCRAVLAADAPEEVPLGLDPAFGEIMADLGIASTDDLLARAEEVLAFLPELGAMAEAIMAANAAITDAEG